MWYRRRLRITTCRLLVGRARTRRGARHTNRRLHANVPRNLIRMSSFTVSTGFATYTGFRAAPQVRAAPVSAAAAD